MSFNIEFKKLSQGISKQIKSVFINPYFEINFNWFKIKYYKHLPAGKIKKHKLFGKSLYFSDPLQFFYGLKEIFIDKLYKQNLSERPYIIDCGANIGLSIIYMKMLYPNAEIIAFEPDEKNFDLLSKNIKSFEYSNVKLFKEAVWINNETLQFSNEGSMNSKIEVVTKHNSVNVKGTRLKELLIRNIDFLKIDIEGAEFRVIIDIADKLHLVKNMFVEYHGSFKQNSELAELLAIINKSGFNFYIKEAAPLYDYPFFRYKKENAIYDIQLNIFCFRD